MSNLYDFALKTDLFKKFVVDELLFMEYKCLTTDPVAKVWSRNNYFSFVLNGKMVLKTPEKEYELKVGDSFFIKKGGYYVYQFFEEIFCDIMIFVPDDFIKSIIEKNEIKIPSKKNIKDTDTVIPLQLDEILETYFNSLVTYFNQKNPPSKALLKLKFEELIIDILSSSNNSSLINYFNDLNTRSKVSIKEIMEANFLNDLSLKQFAQLSARSLSTFKRDFYNQYKIPPGKWITKKRLNHSKYLIDTTNKNINEIIFESGFKNRTHFTKVFKENFGATPLQYKNQQKF
ncbi:MAG: AraC family transcriptional regulator [Ignavibacteriaceae bacterium]